MQNIQLNDNDRKTITHLVVPPQYVHKNENYADKNAPKMKQNLSSLHPHKIMYL